jgi:transposase
VVIIGEGFQYENLIRESTTVRQLGMDKRLAIQHLHQAGFSERQIVEQLGVSRNAVRHRLGRSLSKGTKAPTGSALTGSGESKGTKAPTGSPRESSQANHPKSASKSAAFHEVILAKLEQGLTAEAIHRYLVEEHQFSQKYHSVRRYIAKLGKVNQLPYRRVETEPGEQMQIDFGTGAVCLDHEGKQRRTYVFRAVLSHSRKGYSEAVKGMNVENFLMVLENAFIALGGVPKIVLFDNASCAVKNPDWYDSVLHPKIVDFCKHYGFVLTTTKPGTPRHKGKVERGVAYVKGNALKGREFDSLAAQNEYLKQWEQNVADRRVHGTTKQQVGKLFEEVERQALSPLPVERFPYYEEGRRKVSRDGHIEVKHAFYSAPPEYLGRQVWVRWNNRTLRIFNDRMEQIALHARRERGFSTISDHIAPEKIHSIEKGVEFLLRKVRFIGQYAAQWAELLIEKRGIEAHRSLRGLLSLCTKYDSSAINRACELAWRSGATNYRTVKTLLENTNSSPQQTLEFMEEHPVIRSVSEYANFVRQSIQGG